METIERENNIEYFADMADTSGWKFLKFLDAEIHVYEMHTAIGDITSEQLPKHFKTDANNKALIKYENYEDKLCFWRCLAYHYDKPKDHRDIKKRVKKLFNDFYNQDIKTYDDITKTYKGIEYVNAFELNQDAPYNEHDEIKYLFESEHLHEIDEVEKHFKININVYTNDECIKEINKETGEKERKYIVEIDRRSMLKYEDTLNLMRYKNHFMYIKDLNQIRHSYRCKKCSKIFNNMEACNRHEKRCDELIRHTFIGGKYEASKSIFEKIKDKVKKNKLIKKNLKEKFQILKMYIIHIFVHMILKLWLNN